jgi:hypothetical protein
MTDQPQAAWVEAARIAAERTYEALAPMEQVDLHLQIVSENEATTTNSVDKEFLDYLGRGDHLTADFLAGAK